MPHENTDLLRDERSNEPTAESDITRDGEPTPVPWRTLSILLLFTAMQPLAFEIIFPFVNQMIVETGVVAEPERVGFYSGVIESIFSFMSCITIMPSSYLADRIGRKPVILGGTAGLAISVTSFGMSKSFLAMIISRCIGGALGGTLACTRIMVGELSDKSNQAKAFQWWGIAFRVGQIVGLPLGGLLVHPARNFILFQTAFWREYPFVLPCFVASGLALCSVVIGFFNLRETLPPTKSNKDSKYGTISPPVVSAPARKPSLRSILTPSIISLLAGCVGLCLASETLFAVFPLFAFTPIISGGLGMSEAAIGTQMSIRAMLHIGIMVFYAPLERRFGSTIRLHRLVMCMWPLTILGAPLLNWMAKRSGESTWPFSLALFVYFVIWAIGGLAWTSVFLIVTDAVPSTDVLAAINGLSQLAIVLPQAITPVAVTSLFAVSIQSGIAGGNLIWIILFVFTSGAALHTMTLREPTSNWRNKS